MNRRLTALDGITALIILLLIVQIWLLSATLEAFLAGYHEAAMPGAITSALIFALCFVLYLFAHRVGKKT